MRSIEKKSRDSTSQGYYRQVQTTTRVVDTQILSFDGEESVDEKSCGNSVTSGVRPLRLHSSPSASDKLIDLKSSDGILSLSTPRKQLSSRSLLNSEEHPDPFISTGINDQSDKSILPSTK